MEFIKFNSPIYLLIAALCGIVVWLFHMVRAMPSVKTHQKPILRFLVICLIIIGLSEPYFLIRIDDKCILFAIDASQSIDDNEKEAIKDYISLKIKEKKNNDRIGILQFGEKAEIIAYPSGLSKEELLTKISKWTKSPEPLYAFTDIENALLTASKIFPAGFQKKLVLITDGNENRGDVAGLFDELKIIDVTVDVLPIGGIKHKEVLIKSLNAPTKVRVGNPFSLEASVSSNTNTDGTLRITVDGEEKILINNFSIHLGEYTHKFPLTFNKGGFHDISIRITMKDDGFFQNNSADAISFAESRPKILIVTDPSSDNSSRKHLGKILMTNEMDTAYIPAGMLYVNSNEYINYDAVILDNIPSRLVSSEQMEALSNAVHDIGTGLILIGGDNSTGSDGFAGTPIESALPVSLIPTKGETPSTLDLVFVMDKSGSMSEGGSDLKIRLAADAVQSIIDMFGKEEKVGIIAFDSESHVVTSPGAIMNRDEIAKKIQSIVPRGSTDLYPAMTQAYKWLKGSDASHKHVILLSDGRTRERDFSILIKDMRDADITVSAVAIGRESNIQLMKDIAHMGAGRFFQVEDDLRELAKIFQIDAMTASRSLVFHDKFSPLFKEPDMILNGMPLKMPLMHGYMVTSPKKRAVIPVESHLGDPIIGFWNYGTGRSVVFTGDDGSQWSRDWLQWEGFSRLLVQSVRRSIRPGAAQENLPVFRTNGNTTEIQYELSENMEEIPIKISAKILSSDGKVFDAALFRESEESYRGTISGLAPGKYLAVIAEEKDGNIINLSRGRFIISGLEEFLTLNRNDKLIEDIAHHTGGRILTDNDALFNADEKKTERSIPAWPYFFILAVIIFLADIALRRKLLNH